MGSPGVNPGRETIHPGADVLEIVGQHWILDVTRVDEIRLELLDDTRLTRGARVCGRVLPDLAEIVERRANAVGHPPEGFLAEHRERLEDISSIVASLADRTAVVVARVFGPDNAEPGTEAVTPPPQAAAESLRLVVRRIRNQLEELAHQLDRIEEL